MEDELTEARQGMAIIEITELLPAIEMGLLPPLPPQLSTFHRMGLRVSFEIPLQIMEIVSFARMMHTTLRMLGIGNRELRPIR